MSYSFTVVATTPADAKTKVAAEFDAIVGNQFDHTVDRPAAQQVVNDYIDLMVAPTGDQQMQVVAYGSISKTGDSTIALSLNLTVSVV